jgi:hypothetical protein
MVVFIKYLLGNGCDKIGVLGEHATEKHSNSQVNPKSRRAQDAEKKLRPKRKETKIYPAVLTPNQTWIKREGLNLHPIAGGS